MTEFVRGDAMLWGSFVADAATLGLHWVYDQPRIREIAPQAPEFLAPRADHYAGISGFFAHGTRSAGDLSQYGEQHLVMLQSLSACGAYNRADYQARFRAYFGYGGAYVGYIDRPTRDTLDTMTALEKDALLRSRAVDPSVDDYTHGMMVTKVLANMAQHSGARLRAEIESAVRETHDDDQMVAYAQKVAATVAENFDYPGADDMQLPALSKLPALVERHAGDDALMQHVADAVRVTNNNETAVAFAQTAATLLRAVLEAGALPDLHALINDAAPVVKSSISAALARTHEPTEAVTADIGMSCSLDLGVPSLFHCLATTEGYTAGVRTNIYAGGDNCGRAIVLGAVLGGIYGVPDAWIARLTQRDMIRQAIARFRA